MQREESVAPNIKIGSFYAIIGFFCMALFGILTKVAIAKGSVIWVSFLAYLTGTLLLVPYLWRQGGEYLASSHYGKLLGRAVFGTVASFLYSISIQYIPVVNGTLLFNTAPIFIPLLSWLILKKSVRTPIWLAVAVGFLGIVIIIKPTAALFTQSGNSIALLSGLFLAIAYLLMKMLTYSEPGARIIFYYLSVGTAMQVPLLFFNGAPFLESMCYAALSGVALLAAQLSLVTAYRYAEASEVGIYQYSSVVFVGIMEWALWGLELSYWDLLGIGLVALAGMIIIRSNSR